MRVSSHGNSEHGFAVYAFNLELSLHISASLEGWYVDQHSWRWIFWQNVPLALIMSLCLLGMAHDQFLADALSNLDLLTTEQTLVAVDAAVASSDASLVQDQIAVFKALGAGWRGEGRQNP